MKTDLKSLQDSFETWYNVNLASRQEASEVIDLYHNRQWSRLQIQALEGRGQPKETFNIIKLMTRTLIGYYGTVVNRAVVEPRTYNDITKATLMNDAIQTVYERCDFETVDDDVKMYGFLTGLFVSHTSVRASGKTDMFGRNEYDISISEVNPEEVVIDPLSRKRNYSDARGIHRFRWLSAEEVKKEFGKNQKTIDKLEAYANHTTAYEADFTYRYDTEFIGKYKVDDMYLVVHSVIGTESIFWCGDVELSRTKLTYCPYTVTKLQKTSKEEYYGIFREVVESQKAINQALIQIQLMVNSNKVIVETDAVEDIDVFADSVARVNAVIEVNDLKGVLIQNLSNDVLQQYAIIDNGFNRIKQVLGVNDAMLGQAFAADSGRKVKLQKNNAIMTLRYVTSPLELYHKTLAVQVVELIKEYYTAHQVLRITDDVTGNRFVEINKPLLVPMLPPQLQQLVAQGLPLEYAYEALLTGHLNPMVIQAMQQQQQWQQQAQAYQQEQQQLAQMQNQMQMQMVNSQMSGTAPKLNGTVPPPGPAPMQQLPKVDLTKAVENNPKTKINEAMRIKRPDAPPGMEFVFEEMINPETGEPLRDKQGNILLIPAATEDSKIDIKEYDVVIKPSSYNDEDEKAQLMMEVMLNGPIGQFAAQVSPAYYAKMISLNTQSMKTKHSPEIAKLFNDMAMQLGQNPEFEAYIRQMSAGGSQSGANGRVTDDGNGGAIPGNMSGGGPISGSGLKLPQNTNEGY